MNWQYAVVLTVRARRLLVKRPMLQLRRLAECLFVPPRAFRRPVGSVKFTVHLPTLLLAMSPLLNTTKALLSIRQEISGCNGKELHHSKGHAFLQEQIQRDNQTAQSFFISLFEETHIYRIRTFLDEVELECGIQKPARPTETD